jgi:hypothetical protein
LPARDAPRWRTQLDNEARIATINGVGFDYFVLPHVGLRLAIGLGGDVIFARSTSFQGDMSESAIGFAYTFGTTFDLLEGSGHLSVNSLITVVNFDTTKTVKQEFREPGVTEWQAFPVIGVVVAYSYH